VCALNVLWSLFLGLAFRVSWFRVSGFRFFGFLVSDFSVRVEGSCVLHPLRPGAAGGHGGLSLSLSLSHTHTSTCVLYMFHGQCISVQGSGFLGLAFRVSWFRVFCTLCVPELPEGVEVRPVTSLKPFKSSSLVIHKSMSLKYEPSSEPLHAVPSSVDSSLNPLSCSRFARCASRSCRRGWRCARSLAAMSSPREFI